MVAVGELWEGHELLREERGMVRTFLARQVGDTKKLVSLHLREGARFEPAGFASEIQRLQDITRQIPEIVPVCYGGVVGDVAWVASPVLSDAIPLIDATRGKDHGPTLLKVLIDLGACLVRAHELELIHGSLSPDRVFIAGDGRCAITHFGFVRLFELGAEEARQDPYGYLAPELFSGGRIGRRTDVYGFGTILYELLCKRPFSAWTWPPSFPVGIPPVLQFMLKRALEENPKRRKSSIAKMLSVLTPFARGWEELGAPPEPPHADLFAEPSGSRRKPGETAPILVDNDWKPFASGEQVERAGDLPTPRPSDAPDGGMPPRDEITQEPPVATLRPSESPDTLKSMPPRDESTQEPRVAPRLPSVPALPDLDPALLDPILPIPTPPTPPRSRGTPGRRSPARLLSAVLTLAFLLGSSGAVLRWWEQSPRRAAPHLARVVQAAAFQASAPLPPRPSDAPQAPPPVAPRPITDRQAAFTRQAMKTPSMDAELCDGLVPCGQHDF
jgi:eukaryotic-like serine/threonine-protein kinase